MSSYTKTAGRIISAYRKFNPQAYTSEADVAAASRTRAGMTSSAERTGVMVRAQNQRQVLARHLSGPAAAALEQQATDAVAGGREQAAGAEAEQLYRAGQSNLGYEREKGGTLFGAELGVAANQAQMDAARSATFWNSVLQAVPMVAGAFAGPAGVAAGAAAGKGGSVPGVASYNPGVRQQALRY